MSSGEIFGERLIHEEALRQQTDHTTFTTFAEYARNMDDLRAQLDAEFAERRMHFSTLDALWSTVTELRHAHPRLHRQYVERKLDEEPLRKLNP